MENHENYRLLHDPAGGKNPNPGYLLIYYEYCHCQNLGTFVLVDNVNKNCRLFEGQIVDLGNRCADGFFGIVENSSYAYTLFPPSK